MQQTQKKGANTWFNSVTVKVKRPNTTKCIFYHPPSTILKENVKDKTEDIIIPLLSAG